MEDQKQKAVQQQLPFAKRPSMAILAFIPALVVLLLLAFPSKHTRAFKQVEAYNKELVSLQEEWQSLESEKNQVNILTEQELERIEAEQVALSEAADSLRTQIDQVQEDYFIWGQ